MSSRCYQSSGPGFAGPITEGRIGQLTVGRLFMVAIAASLLALLALVASPAPAAVFTVGSGGGCTSGTINIALFGAALSSGPDEIRVAGPQSNVNVEMTNFGGTSAAPAVTIRGGYSSCSDTTPSGLTEVRGNGGDPVFTVRSTGGSASVIHLVGLDIKESGGRGVLVDGSAAEANIIGSIVQANNGGTKVENGGLLKIAFSTTLFGNAAGSPGFGGGVECNDATLETAGIIQGNSASSGGGVWANSCTVRLLNGAWIQNNSATWGGGLNANSGSLVTRTLPDSGSFGVRVRNNTAANDGGGVYALGTSTVVDLPHTWIHDNEAGADGGGIYAVLNARVTLDRRSTSCFANDCSRLANNRLTTPGNGSAAYAASGARVVLYQTHVTGNSGIDDQGFALYATGPNTQMLLESTIYRDNSTVSLFEVRDSAFLQAAFVSATGNRYRPGGGTTILEALGAQVSTSANLELRSSAFEHHRSFNTNSGGSISADCMVVANASGLGAIRGLAVTSPGFNDSSVGDLALLGNARALDACDNSVFNPSQFDINHIPRGFDTPLGNIIGPYDLGAWEMRGLLVFKDTFERSDTSAWTSATP